MSDNERIIANVNTSMSMEGMALSDEQRRRMLDCLSGKVAYADAVKTAVKKYQQPERVNA